MPLQPTQAETRSALKKKATAFEFRALAEAADDQGISYISAKQTVIDYEIELKRVEAALKVLNPLAGEDKSVGHLITEDQHEKIKKEITLNLDDKPSQWIHRLNQKKAELKKSKDFLNAAAIRLADIIDPDGSQRGK